MIKEIMYSINSVLHANVKGPLLGNLNSSSTILNSSLIISLLRYSKGSRKHFLSAKYTRKQLFSAFIDVLQVLVILLLAVVYGDVILFFLIATIFCYFFTISKTYWCWSSCHSKESIRTFFFLLLPSKTSFSPYSFFLYGKSCNNKREVDERR